MTALLAQCRPPHSIHLIGIGGDGMSSVAGLLQESGFLITGSEQSDSRRIKNPQLIQTLVGRGASIFFDHQSRHIGPDTRLVVRSSAIPDDNPEVLAARERGLPIVKRADLLGLLMKERTSIAVSGTAGKTTTACMLGFALQQLGVDPTVSVGSPFSDFNNVNFRAGWGVHFVAEADEYDRSFLRLHFDVALITNIFFGDHPDCYADLNDLCLAFRMFVQLLPPHGLALGCGDVEEIRDVLNSAASTTIQTYGFMHDNHWRATEITCTPLNTRFAFRSPDTGGICRLRVAGRHNVLNALAVIAASSFLGFSPIDVATLLEAYPGCERRLQLKGVARSICVYDDFGHHPIQIRATLEALRQLYPHQRLFCIFEPRQFMRTRNMLPDLATAFKHADGVIITEVTFGLGETAMTPPDVHARDVVAAISKAGTAAEYVSTLEDAAHAIAARLRPGDVVLTTGTGKVYMAAETLLSLLQQ